jgi:Lipocalin-like domain
MRNRAVFSFLIFVSLQVLCAARKTSSSEGQRFVGVWQSVSITDMRPDGTEVPDLYLGQHPTGMLIYDASGFMCGGNMNPDRRKWTDPSKATREELANAAEGYDSYCGTYTVDEERKRIIHHVRVSLDPNIVGLDLVRSYVFEGKRLKLSGTEGLLPGFKVWTFTFERPTPQVPSSRSQL